MKISSDQKNTALVLVTILAVFFVFIVLQMTVLQDYIHGMIFLLPFLLWAIVGGILMIFTLTNQLPVLLKWSLMAASCAAMGMIFGIVAHNFFYAVGEFSAGESVYSQSVISGYGVFFFIEAVIVCPLVFIVGLISSYILLLRR